MDWFFNGGISNLFALFILICGVASNILFIKCWSLLPHDGFFLYQKWIKLYRANEIKNGKTRKYVLWLMICVRISIYGLLLLILSSWIL